jgi:hypothetical protein
MQIPLIYLPRKQTRAETNWTSFLCRNRGPYHNTEVKTWKHVIWQNEQQRSTFIGDIILLYWSIVYYDTNVTYYLFCHQQNYQWGKFPFTMTFFLSPIAKYLTNMYLIISHFRRSCALVANLNKAKYNMKWSKHR